MLRLMRLKVITSITDLGTTIVLNIFRKMILNINNLVKKAIMMQKILNIESKYFTTFYHFTNRIIDKKDKRKRIN